jgi:hypothetical protein
MTLLTKVGKRLDNITRYILDNNPQDKWVLSNIIPMFLEAVKSSTTIQEEQIIVSQLNKLLDNFEFRYNQMFEKKNKIAHQINQNLQELIEKIKKDFNIQEEKSKRDRCLRIADRKFDKPSAYKSGAVVRCRKGDIWKDIKETDDPQSGKAAPYGSGFAKVKEELILEKVKETLRTWFSRKGAPGKKGGWVDCNTCREVDGKTKCKSCGREKGEERSKYPSCRPTASQCKTPGKGKKWGKTK